MIYKVGLSGASGRIGTEIAGLLSGGFAAGGDFFELGDAVARTKKLVSIDGTDVRLMSEPAREPVHVWIDFSSPEGCVNLLEQIDCPVVIGTTGFTAKDRSAIEEFSKRHPVLLSSNTSPGMTVVQNLLSHVPDGKRFRCEVVLEESHHRHKKDAPSGTAKQILEVLKAAGHPDVAVHVTRAGAVRGYHAVRLITDDEEILISHRVENRTVFARGALLGAQFLLKVKSPRIYQMRDVFSSEEK